MEQHWSIWYTLMGFVLAIISGLAYEKEKGETFPFFSYIIILALWPLMLAVVTSILMHRKKEK